jgi:hypothetical protein
MNTTTSKKTGASSSPPRHGASACAEVKPDLIRRRAYEVFQARNDGLGDQVSDWVQAEQELSGAPHDAPDVIRPGER